MPLKSLQIPKTAPPVRLDEQGGGPRLVLISPEGASYRRTSLPMPPGLMSLSAVYPEAAKDYLHPTTVAEIERLRSS